MTRNNRDQVPGDPLAAAEWWSARRRLDMVSARDEMRFRRWLETPENALAWRKVEGIVEGVSRFAAIPDIMQIREAALAVQPRQAEVIQLRASRWLARGFVTMAAAAAVALVFLTLPAIDTGWWPGSETTSPVEQFATKVGEKRALKLADGSIVTLNTGSLVEVHYTSKRREIRLLAGQAYFKVTKNTARPFVVSAGDRRITATGTAFDVRLDDKGALAVLLVEGRVFVDPIQRNGRRNDAPNVAREELEPGERLIVPAVGPLKVIAADVERDTSWRSGELIFRDELLGDAMAELNRYTETKLVSDDPRVRSLRVSGVFKTGGNANFVAAITSFYPVDAERPSPGVVELAWRGRNR